MVTATTDRFIDDLQRIISEHTAPDIARAIVSAVQAEYGGDQPYINAPKNRKRDQIQRALDQGLPVRVICERLGVSRGWVYKVMNEDA